MNGKMVWVEGNQFPFLSPMSYLATCLYLQTLPQEASFCFFLVPVQLFAG
jgi:hypothetical protein